MKVRALVLIAAVSFACAKPRPEAQSPPRLKNSAPEKSAALRAAQSPRHMEDEDDRWQIEAAKQRKADRAPQTPVGGKTLIPMPPPNEEGRRPDAGAGNNNP